MMSSSFSNAMHQFSLPLSNVGQQSEPEMESISPAPPSRSAAFTSGGASSQRTARSPNRKKCWLSCISCRRSKVKCDKADPCSRCVRLGSICTPSLPSGAPRGRNGGRRKVDHKLLDRITKLENLVKGMEVRYTGEISLRIEDENKEVWSSIRASGEKYNSLRILYTRYQINQSLQPLG